ncbi:ribosomal protein L7/L12 [Microbacterium gorillae]|uniref:ribosomal protein L7/L12 n=1 Tax=Microbacterium gorillae TaxID=1231063 RepID=UPI00058B2186|nr:ribosomal protein L7/L12 [Microbacterium gorillae]
MGNMMMVVVLVIAIAALILAFAAIVVALTARGRRDNRPAGTLPSGAVLNPGPTPAAPPASPVQRVSLDTADVSDEVLRLARSGQKIHAIKLLREQTSIGLADAKRIVENLPL